MSSRKGFEDLLSQVVSIRSMKRILALQATDTETVGLMIDEETDYVMGRVRELFETLAVMSPEEISKANAAFRPGGGKKSDKLS